MTDEEFTDWVNVFMTATGAEPRVKELLWANRQIIVERWRASYAELCEASERLIEQCAVPRFPDQVTSAIGVVLERIRHERKATDWQRRNIEKHGEPPELGKVPCEIDPETRKAFAAYVRRGKAELVKEKRV